MTMLMRLYPGDHAAIMAAFLFVHSTAVMALAWMIARSIARRHPAVRHAVWFWALACLLLIPALSLGFDRAGLSLVPVSYPDPHQAEAPEATAGGAGSVGDGHLLGAARSIEGREPGPSPLDASRPFSSREAMTTAPAGGFRTAVACAFGLWGLGTAFLLARLAQGCILLVRLKRQSRPLEAGLPRDVLDEVRRALGVATLPPITVSGGIDRPVAAGFTRPTVVLPEDLVGAMEPRRLRDVLVHECAHVMRRDHVVGLLQRLVQVVFWPHPLIHVLNREMARAREEICDNFVLAGGDRLAYARTLLEVAEATATPSRTPHAIGLLQACWRLEDRIAGLLDDRRELMTRVQRPMSVAIAGMFLAIGFLVSGLRPAAAAGPMGLDEVKARLKEQRAKIRSIAVAYHYDIVPLVEDPKLLAQWNFRHVLEGSTGLEAVKGQARYSEEQFQEANYIIPQILTDGEATRIVKTIPEHRTVTVISGNLMTETDYGKTTLRDVDYSRYRGLHYLVNVGLLEPGPPEKGGRPEHGVLLLPEALEREAYRVRVASEQIDGSDCLVLEGATTTYWLDPARGLALRQREIRSADGKPQVRTIFSKYEEAIPGVWLPLEFHDLYFAPPTVPKKYLGKPVVDERVRVSSLKVNDPKTDALFKIDPKDADEDFRSKAN